VFVYLGERRLQRAGPGVDRDGVPLQEEPRCIERVDAEVDERAAAGEVGVESPGIRARRLQDGMGEAAVHLDDVADVAVVDDPRVRLAVGPKRIR